MKISRRGLLFDSSFKRNISILMFLAIVINYLDRVNISAAMLLMASDLHLTPVQQGLVLSAFSWGYVLLMLPSGVLVDRFGPKVINVVAVVAWSFFTLLTGAVNGFVSLLIMRVLVGAAEAPIFPGNAKVVSTWFTRNERTRATAIFDVGSYVGGAIATPLIVFTMLSVGWRVAFVLCAVLGLGWALMWSAAWLISYRSPESDREGRQRRSRLFLRRQRRKIERVDWLVVWRLVRQRKVVAASVGFFCYNYLKSFFLTWFPIYLVSTHGFTILTVGFVAIIPPLCAVVAELAAGFMTDRLISRGMDVTRARKIFLCVGFLVSSVVVLSEFTNNAAVVIGLLSLSYAALISASANIWSIPADIAPSKNWVGTVSGIQNTFSNVAGIVAPIVTGALFSATGSFLAPLAVSASLAIVGASSYVFGMGKLEPMAVAGIPSLVADEGASGIGPARSAA